MRFRFIVEVEVERSAGKFAGRDDIGSELFASIEGADPGEITGDMGGEYNVIQWEVTEEDLS